MVFNINSLAPYSRSSIIYDTDFSQNEITIAQPLIPLSSHTRFKELHLTTIIQDKKRRIRIGVKCLDIKIIQHYPLANKSTVPAVILKYSLPPEETNIRSAFRLPLSTRYIIKSKLLYKAHEYFTSRDFSIRDISLTGIGLVIPKKRNKKPNPLTEIKTNETIIIGIILINMDLDKPVGTLPIKSQVTRINPGYSNTHSLVGLKILNLGKDGERILNSFIHDAQIDELKRMSRRNL